MLLPKKSKVMLYLPYITRLKPFNQLYITNKTEGFSFISGRAGCGAPFTYRGMNDTTKPCNLHCSLIVAWTITQGCAVIYAVEFSLHV